MSQLSENVEKRSIDLNPEDWFWATWRNLTPLPRPEPQPFDLQNSLARLRKVTTENRGWNWDWSKANISVSLCHEEAYFWLSAMIQASNQLKPKQLAEQLAKQVSTEICFEKFRETLFKSVNAHTKVADMLSPEICIPLINLFSLVNLIDLIFYLNRDLITISIKQLLSHLIWGFRRYVLPYLTRNEIEKLRQLVQLEFDLSKWSTGYYKTQSPTFHLAACLGLHNELQQLVESWSDDQYDGEYRLDYYHRPQEITFGLANPRLVESHIRRLKLRLQPPAYIQQTSAYIRAWLACTEYAALDYIRDTILTASNKEDAAALTEGFALVKAPEAAPFMLELMLSSKAPQVARKWLEDNPMLAIAGLVSLIGQRRLGKAPVGRLTEAAINWLRSLKRQGSGQLIQTCLDREPDEIAEQVRRAVLDFDEKEYIAFDSRITPEWLKQAIAQVKRSQTPSWLALSDLPPVVVGEYCLNDQQVEALLTALKQSSLDNPHALVTNLKQHSEPTSLDRFAWQLFERWLREGAPSKEKWAFVALGLLGSDASALKLAPMICTMPGEGQHKRAVFGLECLRVMGTDTALTQINGIAQKVKFRPLRAKAQECLEAIAKERNLTREQLEDRIVPDCGLDRNGMQVFNYGNRQFQFAMGPELRPMVRDCNGKFKADLPKPGTNDNIDLANQAIEDWKLLKKQIREVVKIQVARLEQAMIGGRRWQIDEFETLIVKHPLMTHLAQLLLWGGYDTSGKLVTTFRITEDQNYATVTDESAELEEVTTVGIIHPFHLSLELQSAWGQLLSGYEIIPPFLQLGRPIYYLEPNEINQKELTRFSNLKIPAASLVGTFEQRKWLRHVEGVDSGSIIAEHYKHFYGVNLTAIVEHSTGVWIGAIADSEDQIMECCYFVSGVVTPTSYPNSPTKIPLNQVDLVVVSEVLNDLMAIALKAR